LGFVRVCKWLLERDADVNFHDSIVGTPLICAVFYWDLNLLYKTRMPEMVRLLLEHGAKADVQFSDIRARGNFAVTPMSLALDLAEKDTALCSEVIRALLTANVLSSFEQSRFWEMVYRPSYSLRQFRPQHYDMIQLFKEILNHKAATSLNNATKSKVLAFLNRYGTDDAGKNLVSDMATEENLALSPFATAEFARSAAENGQTHLIKSLIEKKADPKVMSECLPISARSGIMEMLDLLLGYCLQNTTTILLNVQKAWINAINGGNVEILKIFLKHGIDVNMVVKQIEQSTPAPPSGRRTQTPETHSRPGIAHALLNGVLESVRFLASLPQTDLTIKVDGRNLLQLAALAHQKRGEMIDVLLDKGADPLERSDRGGTVLHVSSSEALSPSWLGSTYLIHVPLPSL
jgi:ankyrin repeat protein